MIKTHRVKLKLTKSQFELVREKQRESANCWNYIINLSKNYYFEHKQWISNYDIQKLIKGKFNLSGQTIQAISTKFCANRKTIAELRKKGNTKAKYPYKEKKFYIIPFKNQDIRTNKQGNLKITLSAGRYLELNFNIPNIKTAEIVWRNGYYLYYTFDDRIINPTPKGNNTIGVDLGEIHSIASVTNEGIGLIISNREGRSIKQFRNKMYAYISKRLSRCKTGSRQSRKLWKLKNEIRTKTDNQLMNLYHQTTKKFIDFCVEQQVCEIVLGDIKGIEKNTKKKKKLNRVNRQKISQMEYGRIKDYIKYKAKEQGIEVKLVKENYTSQTCPKCSKKHKPQGRTYNCTCGYSTHRDIVGAWNILNKKHKYNLVDFKINHNQPINLKVSTI
ncbi:transposase [Clostridioides sp. ES-S-0108-01]|uniref:RNA-guided endonuclease InsQ/TnpB family protein n=1 Tax=Clostridioides sp. ES-S-0108-01 TaxID=2770773 RepID=UPI001D0C8A05|nr:transposase [Clostridioides sp. ES-S-0108-01]